MGNSKRLHPVFEQWEPVWINDVGSKPMVQIAAVVEDWKDDDRSILIVKSVDRRFDRWRFGHYYEVNAAVCTRRKITHMGKRLK